MPDHKDRRSFLQTAAAGLVIGNKTIESLATRLPGVMPVPAMLVACNRAQEVGVRYAFLS